MKIAITGASGFLGASLSTHLLARGHKVLPIVRRPGKVEAILWDPAESKIEIHKLEGVDCVVHLAGENLFSWRWTASKKKRIWESRVEATSFLCEQLASLKTLPKQFVSASAVGIYGNRPGHEVLSESSASGQGFLAEVCIAWEEATKVLANSAVPIAHLRTGFVVSEKGGGLTKMLPPSRWGLGARMGSGDQVMSWISLEDWVRGVAFVIENQVDGPFNLTAPFPESHKHFVQKLSKALGRPQFAFMPGWAVKVGLGEMGKELLLYGQNASPSKLLSMGFKFNNPKLMTLFKTIL